MKKISMEKPCLLDIKKNRQNLFYNLRFSQLKKDNNKIENNSPEKECFSINEIVKKSVEKINNLFQQQKLMEFDNKTYNKNSNIKKYKSKEYISFHSLNSIEDINKNNINNKNKNDDDLSENSGKNINSGLITDVSALKRNIKQHSFDFKLLFKPTKESKNQIDYIQKSNQNEKKYVIQNIESYETLFNPKSTIDLQESKDNYTPVKTKKKYLFKSEIVKDMTDENNLLNQNNLKTKQNRRNKYYSFYRNKNNKSHKSNITNNNSSKDNFDLVNSIRRYNSKNYFDIDHKRAFSTKGKENRNERYYSLRKNNNNYKTSKTSKSPNFSNNKIQIINQFKIYASTSKRMNKSRTQSHFMNKNNSQILKQLYSKEFPSKIKTNDILKLMLFLNEYIINNNLLDDYYIKKNRKILDDYSKFLAEKINLNYPIENDIIVDDFINKTKIIQRNWRKLKVMKYLEKNKFEEKNEIKKMIINNYIEKAGYKIKKFFGLFHNLIEQFTLLDNKDDFNMIENDINKCFYFTKKILANNLNSFEKNELYRDYMNKVIYLN